MAICLSAGLYIMALRSSLTHCTSLPNFVYFLSFIGLVCVPSNRRRSSLVVATSFLVILVLFFVGLGFFSKPTLGTLSPFQDSSIDDHCTQPDMLERACNQPQHVRLAIRSYGRDKLLSLRGAAPTVYTSLDVYNPTSLDVYNPMRLDVYNPTSLLCL